jgi:acyl carrier protein
LNLNDHEIYQKVNKILVELFHKETNLEPDENLGLDSLSISRLMVTIEGEFLIDLEDDEMLFERYNSISSITSLLIHKLSRCKLECTQD